MLTFLLCADSKLRQTLSDDDIAMLVCVADFNHTDIILLFDDEVLALVNDALYTGRKPVWLTYQEIDEWTEKF